MRCLRLIIVTSLLGSTLVTTGCETAIFRFANRGLAPPEASVVFAPDIGLAMDVYRPALRAGRKAPVVVFFYGGAWQRGEKSQYRFIGRRLAENGVLVFIADYRTYPRAVFPKFVDDAARAVCRARDDAAKWGGDSQRLFLAGHSAGAHIAALLATDSRYLQRYGVKVTDLAGVVGLSGPYDFVVSGRLQDVFGASEDWPDAQPLNFVDGDEPPFLLIHGVRDRVVETKDSIELAAKLRVHGVGVELKLLPKGTHSTPLVGLYDPRREPTILRAVLDFVRK